MENVIHVITEKIVQLIFASEVLVYKPSEFYYFHEEIPTNLLKAQSSSVLTYIFTYTFYNNKKISEEGKLYSSICLNSGNFGQNLISYLIGNLSTLFYTGIFEIK